MLLTGDVDKLVVQASQEDIAKFGKTQRPIVLNDAPNDIAAFDFNHDQYLYNKFGQRVAVVTSVDVSVQPLDVTSHGDMASRFLKGPMRASIRAEALKVGP